jgi:hypothetical protein
MRRSSANFPGTGAAWWLKKRSASSEIRDVPGMKKKPRPQNWTAQAPDGRRHRAGNSTRARSQEAHSALHGALLKNEQDVHLFERLAISWRGEGR